MRKQKTFDCVQMKSDIQEKMYNEFHGLADKKRNEILFDRISKNPNLSKHANKYAKTK